MGKNIDNTSNLKRSTKVRKWKMRRPTNIFGQKARLSIERKRSTKVKKADTYFGLEGREKISRKGPLKEDEI